MVVVVTRWWIWTAAVLIGASKVHLGIPQMAPGAAGSFVPSFSSHGPFYIYAYTHICIYIFVGAVPCSLAV